MKQTYFFQYNLPADNHINNKPDYFINVVAERQSYGTVSHVFINPLLSKADLFVILSGARVVREMQEIAENHFAKLDVPFPESNAFDITETHEGQNAVAMMHSFVNNFGKNVRS